MRQHRVGRGPGGTLLIEKAGGKIAEGEAVRVGRAGQARRQLLARRRLARQTVDDRLPQRFLGSDRGPRRRAADGDPVDLEIVACGLGGGEVEPQPLDRAGGVGLPDDDGGVVVAEGRLGDRRAPRFRPGLADGGVPVELALPGRRPGTSNAGSHLAVAIGIDGEVVGRDDIGIARLIGRAQPSAGDPGRRAVTAPAFEVVVERPEPQEVELLVDAGLERDEALGDRLILRGKGRPETADHPAGKRRVRSIISAADLRRQHLAGRGLGRIAGDDRLVEAGDLGRPGRCLVLDPGFEPGHALRQRRARTGRQRDRVGIGSCEPVAGHIDAGPHLADLVEAERCRFRQQGVDVEQAIGHLPQIDRLHPDLCEALRSLGRERGGLAGDGLRPRLGLAGDGHDPCLRFRGKIRGQRGALGRQRTDGSGPHLRLGSDLLGKCRVRIDEQGNGVGSRLRFAGKILCQRGALGRQCSDGVASRLRLGGEILGECRIRGRQCLDGLGPGLDLGGQCIRIGRDRRNARLRLGSEVLRQCDVLGRPRLCLGGQRTRLGLQLARQILCLADGRVEVGTDCVDEIAGFLGQLAEADTDLVFRQDLIESDRVGKPGPAPVGGETLRPERPVRRFEIDELGEEHVARDRHPMLDQDVVDAGLRDHEISVHPRAAGAHGPVDPGDLEGDAVSILDRLSEREIARPIEAERWIDLDGAAWIEDRAGVGRGNAGGVVDDLQFGREILARLDRQEPEHGRLLAGNAEEEGVAHCRRGAGEGDGVVLSGIGGDRKHRLDAARLADAHAVALAGVHLQRLVEGQHIAGDRPDAALLQTDFDDVIGDAHPVAAGADQMIQVAREAQDPRPQPCLGDPVAGMPEDQVRIGDAWKLDLLVEGRRRLVPAVVEDERFVLDIVLVAVDELDAQAVRQLAIVIDHRKVARVARGERLDDRRENVLHRHRELAVQKHRDGAPGGADVPQRVAHRGLEVPVHVECPAERPAEVGPALDRGKVDRGVRLRPGVARPLQHQTEVIGRAARRDVGRPGRARPAAGLRSRQSGQIGDYPVKLLGRLDAQRRDRQRLAVLDRRRRPEGLQRRPDGGVGVIVAMVVGGLLEADAVGADAVEILEAIAPADRVVALGAFDDEDRPQDRIGVFVAQRQGAAPSVFALLAGVGVDIDEAVGPDDVDDDLARLGRARPLDEPVLLGEFEIAEIQLHDLAGIERLLAVVRIAAEGLDLDVVEILDWRLADLDLGDLERAMAPDEEHPQILIVAVELGIGRGRVFGGDPMFAEDDRDRLPAGGLVLPAGDRIELLAVVVGPGVGRRKQRVEGKVAAEDDGGRDHRAEDRAGDTQDRRPDDEGRKDDEGQRQDGPQDIADALAGDGPHQDDIAGDDAMSVPTALRDRLAIDGNMSPGREARDLAFGGTERDHLGNARAGVHAQPDALQLHRVERRHDLDRLAWAEHVAMKGRAHQRVHRLTCEAWRKMPVTRGSWRPVV